VNPDSWAEGWIIGRYVETPQGLIQQWGDSLLQLVGTPRHGDGDVEEGQLPRQRRGRESVLSDEEGDVLRTRKGIPQLCRIPGKSRRIRRLVQHGTYKAADWRRYCIPQEHACPSSALLQYYLNSNIRSSVQIRFAFFIIFS
jgi:hypothetical protein